MKIKVPLKDLKDAKEGQGGKAVDGEVAGVYPKEEKEDDEDETDPVKRAEKEEKVKDDEKKRIDAKIKALKGGVNKENIKLKEVNPAELQAPN